MKKSSTEVLNKSKKISLTVLSEMASIFAQAACSGRMYEPQVPSKLKK